MRRVYPGMLLPLLAGLAAARGSAALAVPAPRPPIAQDPRLQMQVEGTVLGRSLGTFLAALSPVGGVALTADEVCGDQKLILAVRSARLGEVLNLVEKQFDYRWTPLAPAAAGGPPAGYRLVASKERRSLSARLREAAERENANQILARLELRLQHLDSPPEVLARLRDQDPFIQDIATNPGLRTCLRAASLLTPAQRRGAAEGHPYVSPTLDLLPPDIQAIGLQAIRGRGFPPDPALLHYTLCREGEDGADGLCLRIIEPDGRPIGGASLTFTRSPRRASGMPIMAYATDPKRKPADPNLQREAELRDERGEPVTLQMGLPALLTAFHRASGLEVLADYYAGQTPRFDVAPLGRRPLWQLLNIITEQFSLGWKRKGAFLLIRTREWYQPEAEEIPERLLNRWRTDKLPAPRVSAPELVDVLADLSTDQLRGLRYQFSGLVLFPPYRWEQLLAALEPDQRQALLDGLPLPATSLAPSARTRFIAVLPPSPPDPPADPASLQLRAAELSGALHLSIGANPPLATSAFTLPLKLRLLPPVSLQLQPAR